MHHLIDTLLLASAAYLSYSSAQYPIEQNWINAKLCGLLAYIILGMFALHGCKKIETQFVSFVLALLAFCYTVLAATTGSAIPI